MGWRDAIVGAVLFVMCAAAGVLTLESRRAAATVQHTADRVLRDYASFAAWEYGRISARALEEALNAAIPQPTAVHLAHTTETADDCECDARSKSILARFQLNTGSGAWIGEAPAREVDRALIVARVRNAATEGHERGVRLSVLPAGAGALAWHLDPRGAGEPPVAHGVLVASPFVEGVLRRAAAQPLLPPALVKTQEAGGLLALKVTSEDGRVLFASDDLPWHPETASERIAGPPGLSVAASLSPRAAPQLIIGGLPRPRLLFVYALLGFAAALVVTAGYLMRREAELARSRAEFVSGVSHELRTPLAQIRMFAETLRLGRVRSPAESTRALDVILQESQRLSNLAENVLVFSRGKRTDDRTDRAPTSLSVLIEEIAQDLQPLARARRANIATALAPGVGATVNADALRQIVINLVDNALKYGPPGQTVRIGLVAEAGNARFWVEDQGAGVPAGDVRNIWKPFWRRGKAGQGGSGIGLSIVRDLVRLHDGKVCVDPECTTGARFVVTLPALDPLPVPADGSLDTLDTAPRE